MGGASSGQPAGTTGAGQAQPASNSQDDLGDTIVALEQARDGQLALLTNSKSLTEQDRVLAQQMADHLTGRIEALRSDWSPAASRSDTSPPVAGGTRAPNDDSAASGRVPAPRADDTIPGESQASPTARPQGSTSLGDQQPTTSLTRQPASPADRSPVARDLAPEAPETSAPYTPQTTPADRPGAGEPARRATAETHPATRDSTEAATSWLQDTTSAGAQTLPLRNTEQPPATLKEAAAAIRDAINAKARELRAAGKQLPGSLQGWSKRVSPTSDFLNGLSPLQEANLTRELRNLADIHGLDLTLPGERSAPTTKGASLSYRKVVGAPIDDKRTAFHADSGTLGIPREQMPQVAAEHRGALANSSASRGMKVSETDFLPVDLRPSQADFEPARVNKASAIREAGDATPRRITEGRFRTEFRGGAQAGKTFADGVRGKGWRVGSVARSMGQILLASLIGAQALNLFTRGQPTWQNDEEGHRWDAFNQPHAPSKYSKLRGLLDDGDLAGARDELKQLVAGGAKPDKIRQAFGIQADDTTRRPLFTGSKKTEKAMFDCLTPAGRKTYFDALKEHGQLAQRLRQVLAGGAAPTAAAR